MQKASQNASTVSWSYSIKPYFLKHGSQHPPCYEIMFPDTKLNKLYYGRKCTCTFLPLRDNLLNKVIKTRAEDNALTEGRYNRQVKWFPENNQCQYTKPSTYPTNNSEGLDIHDRINEKDSSRADRLVQFHTNLLHTNDIKFRGKSQPQIQQYEMAKEINKAINGWTNNMLRMTEISTANLLYETAVRKKSHCFNLGSSLIMVNQIYPFDAYLMNKYISKFSSNDLFVLKRNHKKNHNTSIRVTLPKVDYSNYSLKSWRTKSSSFLLQATSIKQNEEKANMFYSIHLVATTSSSTTTLSLEQIPNAVLPNYQLDSSTSKKRCTKQLSNIILSTKLNSCYTKLLAPMSLTHLSEDPEVKFQIEPHLRSLKVGFTPYAQMLIVYNVMEQTSSKTKEKGTSQMFKKKSQGIGTVSDNNSSSTSDSSSTLAGRRAIKVESCISFSVELFSKKKSSVSDVSGPDKMEPQEGKTKKKRGKGKKKSLHRCFCTMSFPTEDKKAKPEPCEPGVCVPNECTPSACLKRIQQKRGGKKGKKQKSTSEVSSSEASQTSKKKGKKEKAGKQTLLKEKGSSSISKYKENVQTQPAVKEQGKVTLKSYFARCCNKLLCRKGKPLKDPVTGTNISVKANEVSPYGSNASSQAGKKKDTKTKKGTKKEEKAAGKKIAEAGVGDQVKKGKKAKKGTDASGKGDEATKATGKKSKKAKEAEAKKVMEEKGKKPTGKKGKGKKVSPLKEYECEPGVCSPKVCIPQECYDRKFPPPPKPPATKIEKFKLMLRKCCCKGKKRGGVSLDAGTQSRKSAGPEKTPGVTVYKETGSSAKRGKKEPPILDSQVTSTIPPAQTRKSKKRDKDKVDVGISHHADGEESGAPQSRKQKGFGGVQYYQNLDNGSHRQAVNIGSECSCSVEFYKMAF